MSKDKYDEYYLTLTQAKNLEKRGLEAQALETYIKITEDYLPDTDFAFERAVLILEKKLQFSQAMEVCQLALKRIAEEDMRGEVEFYQNRLTKLEEKHKVAVASQKKTEPSAVPQYFKRSTFFAVATAYILVSALLSLPFKLAKFSFLIFLAITGLLLIDIIKNLQRQITIKLQSFILVFALIVTIVSASFVPPPDWTNFFSFDGFSQVSDQSTLENPEPTEEETGDSSVGEADLDKLEALLDKDLIISDYVLSVDGSRMDLTVYLVVGATKDEAKGAISGLLLELNSIKGYSRPENGDEKLGNLYKDLSVSIDVFDSLGARMLRGQLNRANQRISWR